MIKTIFYAKNIIKIWKQKNSFTKESIRKFQLQNNQKKIELRSRLKIIFIIKRILFLSKDNNLERI